MPTHPVREAYGKASSIHSPSSCVPDLGSRLDCGSQLLDKVANDGRRILVMLSYDPPYDRNGLVMFPDGRTIDLHKTFSASGVYDAKTLAPVWQVNWFAHPYEIVSSPDLRYVARLNRFALTHSKRWIPSTTAIEFFDNGQPIAQHDGTKLVTGMRQFLPYTSFDWHVRWYGKFEISSGGTEVLLTTARRQIYICDHKIDLGMEEHYTFNLATGAILTQTRTGGWIIYAYGAGVILILVIAGLGIKILWRKLRTTRKSRGFPITPLIRDPTHSHKAPQR